MSIDINELVNFVNTNKCIPIVKFINENNCMFATISDISDGKSITNRVLNILNNSGYVIYTISNYEDDDEIKKFIINGKQIPMEGIFRSLRVHMTDDELKGTLVNWNTNACNYMRVKLGSHSDDICEHEYTRDEGKDKAYDISNHLTLDDYKSRQLRCYNNKIQHGFNVTDFQKEARFILKELSELMDAIEHNDVENLIEELGDIVIFCYGIAEMAHKDLDSQVFKKMGINERRVYVRNEHGDFVKRDE